MKNYISSIKLFVLWCLLVVIVSDKKREECVVFKNLVSISVLFLASIK
jgi:hypothetical protein